MILVLLAAAAQAAAQPLPATRPDFPPPAAGGMPNRPPRRQLFVAPSGEPFRASAEAPYPVADWFARANTSRDGKLTEAQFTADFVAFAATLDRDHDGTIDSAELQNYETNILPEVHASDFGSAHGGDGGHGAGGWGGDHARHGGDDGGSDSGRPKPPQGAARFGLLPLPEPVAAMDTELRGRITRQAVLAAAYERFAQLDTAHRGYLVLAELPKTWTQTRREMFRKRRAQGAGNWQRRGGPGDGGSDGRPGGDFGGGAGGFGGGDDGAGSKDQGNPLYVAR